MDEEDIHQRHRRELKDLQTKCTTLKKSAPVSDKKRRKEVLGEIAALEKELQERHERELAEFQPKATLPTEPHTDGDASVDELSGETANLEITPAEVAEVPDGSPVHSDNETATEPGKKATRAQRRRQNKQAKQAELKKSLKPDDTGPIQVSARTMEKIKLKKILDENGLRVVDMPADGNCLYFSLVHQLKLHGVEKTVKSLREMAGGFMRAHRDEFQPFVHEDFDEYCREVVETNAWGSQVELRALSAGLQRPIRVLQAEGPEVFIGEEYQKEAVLPLTVVFHRHELSLGEHYNSVIPKDE
ncbi:deubiquitinase OTUD6B-like [Paramacrobiotus metropolitanus]|uniref:deubiquitinase OTUD6B-like n=1 Tax=Paramacrobiotus metropolitanus TaxID=2943436 RepID=UPI0024458A25|nr:deubiquitinase OTUD6B-like [Paramacrobiotus metropolitanus]